MKTKWELSEPNMESAKRDNADGICAMKDCTNKLSNPPETGFLGVKVCDECRMKIDKIMVDISKDIYMERMSWFCDVTTEGNEKEK